MPGVQGYDHDGGVQPNAHIPTEKTRAKVVGLSFAGYNVEDIAAYFDISIMTLYKHYRDELREAKLDRIDAVASKSLELALNGSEKMIELILKTQGKWAAAKALEDIEKDKKQTSLMEKLIDKVNM